MFCVSHQPVSPLFHAELAPVMDSVLLLQPVETLASYLDQKAGFKYLPDHMHTIVFAFLACFGIQLFLSPFLSSRFFPKSYPNFKPKTR